MMEETIELEGFERGPRTIRPDQWPMETDPVQLLWAVRSFASDRKMRLFTVACCRMVWAHVEPHPPIRLCVEFAERYADGVGAKKRMKKLLDQNKERYERYGGRPGEDIAVAFAASAARTACEPSLGMYAGSVCHSVNCALGISPAVGNPDLSALVREIFGNPFRPVAATASWFNPTVTALASAIYADRAFDRLPILADALEEAGCDHPDVLAHCRGDGPHVRGCWAVDLVLGKN